MKNSKNSIRHLLFLLALTLPSLAIADQPEEQPKQNHAVQDGKTPQESLHKTMKFNAGFKKGFFIQSDDENFLFRVGGYVQSHFFSRVVEGDSNESTFRMRRIRFKFHGHLVDPAYQYLVEYEYAGTKLMTGFLRYKPNQEFSIIAGQYKVPFNVEGQGSASTQLLVDRSLIHRVFGFKDERDIGFGIAGVLNDKIEYGVGMFNGAGLNNGNQDNKFLYAGRISYHVFGVQKPSFSSMQHKDKTKLSFALGGFFEDETDLDTGNDLDIYSATSDVMFHTKRLHSMAGFFYRHKNDGGVSTDDYGWIAQAGYMVLPKQLEVAARVVQTYLEGQSNMHEYGLGLNFHFKDSKNLKLQTDYTLQQNVDAIAADNDQINHQMRAQLQFKI